MKNPKSKITKALLSFAGIAPKKSKKYYSRQKPIPYRYVLTGTPAPNDESEYWAQIKMITGRGNDIFHDNFYVFRSQYFYSIPLGATGQRMWKFRKQSRPEFMEQLKQVTHVVSKKDAVDLPSQIHEVRHVKLTDKEQKAYNEMVNEKVLEFENEDVLSRSALVEVMKLRQLTSGFCYGDEGIHQVGKSKLNELRDLLDEIGNHQVIIWCNFRYEIIELLKMLPNSAALWAGTKDREKVITDFKNGKKQYLIANMQSASHGLTFTNCNYGVYFSLSYSYEFQKQSQDRIHRIGQTDKVTYYYLVAKDTIDEVIYEAVNGKAQLSTEVLNYLRKDSNARNRQAVTV
jgi:SNF2 family DNA or RNA helicase